MSDYVSLSSFQLLVGSRLPTKEFLESAFEAGMENKEYEGTWHRIERELIEDRFYWFYSNFGRAMPHRDIVIDTSTQQELQNPRTTEQVEPNDQFFAIYDSETAIFYISNLKKKSFITSFLKDFSDQEILIKNIYKSIDEFLGIINSLESIKFTGERNLFSRDGDLFTSLKNIFGYGEPEIFSIEAKYHTPMKDALKREIIRLAGYQGAGDLKTLVCIGKDEKGFDTVFNTNNFINKISIPLQKDNQSLFPPEEVKEQAVMKLKEMLHV